MNAFRFTSAVTFLLLLAGPLVSGIGAEETFLFGSRIEDSYYFTPGNLNLSTLDTLGINDMFTFAVSDPASYPIKVDTWESHGIAVRGSNTPAFVEGHPDEVGRIQGAVHYRSPVRAVYNFWEAEDSYISEPDVHVGLTYRIGRQTAQGWIVSDSAGDPADTVYDGPNVLTNSGTILTPIRFRVRYRMRLTDVAAGDSLNPICNLLGYRTPEALECYAISNPIYDTLLRARDFRDAQGQYGTWREFEKEFQYISGYPLPPNCSGLDTNQMNLTLEYRIFWHGNNDLEIDWIKCVDVLNGFALVFADSLQLREPIRRQAKRFAQDSVASWFGDESGWFWPSMFGSYLFVDDLVSNAVQELAPGRSVHLMQCAAMRPLGEDAGPHEYWDHYLYKMHKYGTIHDFDIWYIGFKSDKDDGTWTSDSVNVHWYNSITKYMRQYVNPAMDSFPQSRVIGEVQCWSEDGDPNHDKFPRKTDVSCQSFLYLACGAEGLGLNRLDGGIYSTGQPAWGLVYKWPDKNFSLYHSPRYYAVRDWVSPLLVDTSGQAEPWGDLLLNIDWTGVGSADTLADPQMGNTAFNLISGFAAGASPSWVEAGFFADPANQADYLMLVNRRTVDDTSQTVVVDIDATKLQAASATHYYVIDMNPQDTLRGEDTLLAGPIAGTIRFAEKIRPGGVKLMRIEAAPNRMAASDFPQKWWGAIHVLGGVTLSGNRTLDIAAGSQVNIHMACGYSPEYRAQVNIYGCLKAAGTADSIIVFDRIYDGPTPPLICDPVGDPSVWGGFVFSSSMACSVSYVTIRNAALPLYSFQTPVVVDHLTTVNSGDTACFIQGVNQQFEFTNCVLDGAVKANGGRVSLDYCRIDGASVGLEASPFGGSSDTLLVKHSVIVNSDSIGIIANGYPVSLRNCTLSVADIGIQSRATAILIDTVTLLNCGQGVLIDSNATISGKGLHASSSPIGIVFRKGWGSLDSSYVVGADTGVVADPGTGKTVTFTRLGVVGQSTKKGIVARSGVIALINSDVYATALTGLDAYTGTAVIRLDTTDIEASPTSAAAVSVGPNARIVAKKCNIHDSYIGMELRRNGADTIMSCTFTDNALYGIWCDSGTVTDLLYGNYIVNDTASALNFGVNVLLQPVKSVSDTIWGGYNWNFNFNSGHRADVIGLVARGKVGDDWGLVFNGPLVSNDSAFALAVDVRDRYDGAHLYLKSLYASIKESHFVSTGNSLTASGYGIKDMGSTTGKVRCTEVARQKTDLVYVASGSSINWGSAADHGKNNIFAGALSATVHFRKLGGTTALAEYNWWGSSPPDSSDFVGPVDRTPYETDSVECYDVPPAKLVGAPTLPAEFALDQNFPNPFNPATTIGYSLASEQFVRIEIFNLLGRTIRQFDLGSRPPGVGSLMWDGRDQSGQPVGSGVYFYRITSEAFAETKKMLFLK